MRPHVGLITVGKRGLGGGGLSVYSAPDVECLKRHGPHGEF